MALIKRNGSWGFKKFDCYIFYLNKKNKVIKEFRCSPYLLLHDKHSQFMMADPGYFSK